MTKADELRQKARDARQEAADSFERSDTDGFLSQWASGISAREYDLQASIEDAGGVAEFRELYNTGGDPVPSRRIETRYGEKFAVFASEEDRDSYDGEIIAWLPIPYTARQHANLAKKGYRVAIVSAPAKAKIMASGTGLSGAASAYVGLKRLPGEATFLRWDAEDETTNKDL